MAESSKPSWRKGSASGGSRSGQGSKRFWLTRRVDPTQGKRIRYRARLIGLGIFTFTLIVVFLVALLVFHRDTTVILVGVADYADERIPPNSFVDEDLRRFGSQNLRVVRYPSTKVTPDVLEFLAERSRPQVMYNQDIVVVYISAHGAVDENGVPCLLLSDADPHKSSTWLPVERVLKSLQRPGRTKILLVLDCGKMSSSWNLGVLYNSFAKRVAEQVADGQGIYVLLPCAPGQTAWCAPELNGSVFAYYLAQGLRRAGPDKRITLRELHDFVRSRVDRYVRNYRASVQSPQLVPEVPERRDFVVTFDDRGAAEREEQSLEKSRSEWRGKYEKLHQPLRALWQNYAGAVGQRDEERWDPLGLAIVEQKLVRLEQLSLAGAAYASAFEQTRLAVENELASGAAAASASRGALRGFSLPLAMQLAPVRESASEREEWARRWSLQESRPKDEKGEPEKRELSYLAAADVAWRALLARPSVRARFLRELLAHVDESPRDPLDLVEIQFLRLADRYLDRTSEESGFDEATGQALRAALEARNTSELAAAPDDVRIHYWMQSLIARGDDERRLAEDRLFVGDPDSLRQSRQSFEQLVSEQGAYRQAAVLQTELGKYYAARDRAWAQLPSLAEWLVGYNEVRGSLDVNLPFESLVKDLQQLTADVGRLGAELDAAPPAGTADLAPTSALKDTYVRVQTSHSNLRTAFDTFCRELVQVTTKDASRTLRAVHLAIRSPRIAVQDRHELFWGKYVQIMFDFERPWKGAEDRGEQPGSNPQENQLKAHLAWLGGLERHPALAVLDRTLLSLPEDVREPELKRADESEAWLERQGGAVRHLLGQIEEVARKLEDRSVLAMQNPQASDRVKRLDLSKADRLTRPAASLLARRPWKEVQDDPQRRLQAVDRHFQLLWLAHRTLDDFYGPDPREAGAPYFEQAARAYLAAARAAFEAKLYMHGFTNLADLLDRRGASAKALTIQADNVVTLGSPMAESHRAELHWQDPPGTGEVATYLERDAGGGTFRLQPVTDQETAQEVRRRGRSINQPSPVSVRHRIPLDKLTDLASTRWQSVLLFRGHLRPTPFRIDVPSDRIATQVVPETRDNARVVVVGEGSQVGHVLFILDCSGTMNSGGRMTAARTSLRTVLEALRAEEKCWVGLMAYGHRSRFRDDNHDERADFDANGKPIHEYSQLVQSPQDQVHPDVDVQQIVKQGPIANTDQSKAMEDALRRLEPHGQTPLYLALTKTLSAVADGFADEPKHLVLITDGLNFQTSYVRDVQGPDGRLTTYEDVRQQLEEMRGRGVKYLKIDIVFIDEENVRKDRNADTELNNLRSLSALTQGTYVAASDTKELIEALRKALNLVQYSVVSRDTREVPEDKRLNLKKEWGERPFTPSSPGFRMIRIHGNPPEPSCPVVFQGGEALELRYFSRDNRLTFVDFAKAYAERLRAWPEEPVEDPLDRQQRYAVNALGPDIQRESDGTFVVDFHVAVQNADLARFTPRPEQVWAEIQPLSRSNEPVGRPFHFFDLDFSPDRPVPVFRFRARGWPDPSVARQGQISVWFKFKDEPAASQQSVDAAGARKPFPPVKNLAGVTFEAWGEPIAGTGRYRVTIAERHEDREAAGRLASVRCLQPAERITRRAFYFAERTSILHEFEFPRPQATEFRIQPRTTIVQDAVSVRGLKVEVRY